MDGQRVKQWEARCIEEQPPACAAGCPLRVDVRAMLEKIKAGDFAAACAIYARVAPLPAVLSRICDHPCENVCRRAEAGGAIRIGALERACIEAAYPSIRRTPQPARRPKRVAIVGAGLAGLTAAFDLAMKGSAVIVFEAEARPLPRVASRLSRAPAARPLSTPTSRRCERSASTFAAASASTRPALSALIAGYDAILIATGRGQRARVRRRVERDGGGLHRDRPREPRRKPTPCFRRRRSWRARRVLFAHRLGL